MPPNPSAQLAALASEFSGINRTMAAQWTATLGLDVASRSPARLTGARLAAPADFRGSAIGMENFVKIAEGLEVGAALAELAGQPDYLWLRVNPDASRYISLLGAGGARRLEAELPETWRLIDAVRCDPRRPSMATAARSAMPVSA